MQHFNAANNQSTTFIVQQLQFDLVVLHANEFCVVLWHFLAKYSVDRDPLSDVAARPKPTKDVLVRFNDKVMKWVDLFVLNETMNGEQRRGVKQFLTDYHDTSRTQPSKRLEEVQAA